MTGKLVVRIASLALLASLPLACGRPQPQAARAPESLPWEEVLRRARGQTVTWAMWQGDPYINAYVRDFVAPRLAERFGVTLKTVSAQGNAIVTLLMTEMEAKKPDSAADLVWINGETFYQLRQIDALWGPFTDRLPNAAYIDWTNRFIRYDFQQEVLGFECPWGNVQLALIYDSDRVPDPPRTREALERWVREHPGRFTFDGSFTGLTFLKSVLIDLAGGEAELAGKFDEARYTRLAPRLWAWVDGIRPFLWKRGETFPTDVAQLHQLFAGGEVDFTMSNNDGEVDNKVAQGLLPPSARAYVLDSGTIQNTHYVGIVKRAAHKEAALVAIDFLISPEAQIEKLKPAVWGDGSVLDPAKLPERWKDELARLPPRRYAPPRSAIEAKALQELAPEYMLRLYRDFRQNVVEK